MPCIQRCLERTIPRGLLFESVDSTWKKTIHLENSPFIMRERSALYRKPYLVGLTTFIELRTSQDCLPLNIMSFESCNGIVLRGHISRAPFD